MSDSGTDARPDRSSRTRLRFTLADLLLLTALGPVLFASWREIREVHDYRDSWQLGGLVVSRDGRFLARSVNREAFVYDLHSRRVAVSLSDKAGFFAMAPNSRRLAFVTVTGSTITVVDLPTGRPVWKRKCRLSSERVPAMTFSPDGAMLAVEGEQLDVWDTERDRLRVTVPVPWKREFETRLAETTLAFSPDSNFLAVAEVHSPGRRTEWLHAGRGYYITVWKITSGERVAEFHGAGSVAALAFSPDGETVDVLVPSPSGEIHRYAIRHGSAPSAVSLESGGVLDYNRWFICDFSPDGRYLAFLCTEGESYEIRVWDRATGRLAARTAGGILWKVTHRWKLTFTSDGRHLLATDGKDTLLDWEASSGEWTRRRLGLSLGPPVVPWVTAVLMTAWLGLWILAGRRRNERFAGPADLSRWMVAVAALYLVGNALPYYYVRSRSPAGPAMTACAISTVVFLEIAVLPLVSRRFRGNWLFAGLSILAMAAVLGGHCYWLWDWLTPSISPWPP